MEASEIFYVLLALFLALFVAFFQYYSTIKKKKDRSLWIAVVLRFLSVFFILLLLFNPKFKKKNIYLEKPVLAVAVDNSSSVSYLKQDENAQSLIKGIKESSFLNDRFDISYFTFGNDLNTSSDPDFSETQTRISDLLESFNKLYKDSPLASILITDGNQTYGSDYSFQSTDPAHKIYPVLLGDTLKVTDLKIRQINCNKYAFSGNNFPVELFLTYEGDKPVSTRFSVFKGNTEVYSENINFKTASGTLIKNITLPANKTGIQVYKAQLAILDEEQNKLNNTKEFAIEVIDERSEVLLISEVMHPDLGALKKSIESNEQRVVTFAKSRVSQQEIENSQLVILYQPTTAFKGVVDKLKKQNRNYLLISGAVTDWNFVNSIQNNFQKEWIRQTEEIQAEKNINFNVFNVDEVFFEDYPPLKGFLGDVTFSVPFETVLFDKIKNVKLESPLLATYEKDGARYGLLNGEGIWKWRAYSYVKEGSFEEFDSFFGKLIFYLSSNKKRERLTVDYDSFYDGSNELKITASYFNKNYEFDKGANLLLSLTNTDTKITREIPMVLRGNYYEADISTFPSGSYKFKVAVADKNISKTGNFKILEFDIEKQFLTADKERLNRLAERSGGSLFYPNQLNKLEKQLVNEINFKPIQKSNLEVVSLIDFEYILFIIAVLLSAEWFLRKYKGHI
jgi:hypothetical protein